MSPTCLSYLRAISDPSVATYEPSSSTVRSRPCAIRISNVSRPWSAPGDAAVDHRRHAHRHGRRLIVHEHHDDRERDVDTVDGADRVDRRDRHRGPGKSAERAARGVREGQLARVVRAAALDKGVDLVRHRSEHDQRPDADRDSQDRERRPDLPAAQVAEVMHRSLSLQAATSGDDAFARAAAQCGLPGSMATPSSGRIQSRSDRATRAGRPTDGVLRPSSAEPLPCLSEI